MERKNSRGDRDVLEDFVDLCSEGEQGDNRHSKRRKEMRQNPKQQDQIVDLSASSPDGVGPSDVEASERRLWGEVEAPPRWNQARRRSALCQQNEMLNAMAHTSATAARPFEARGVRQDGGELQGGGRLPRAPHPFWRTGGQPVSDTLQRDVDGGEPTLRMRPRSDAALARRLQAREESSRLAATRAQLVARQMEEDEMTRRMNELEELEAMEDDTLCGAYDMAWLPQPPAAPRHPQYHHHRATSQMRPPPQPRSGHRQTPGWVPESLAEAMMGMLSEGSLGSMQHLGSISDHVAAVRRAMGTLSGPGRLPPHLMYSDRDFDENDYEQLLALDDNVASRKGASAKQIDTIPTVLVGCPGGEVEKDCRCLICLEDLEPGACLRKMVCKHQFHKACLDKWLAQKSTCPICQQSLNL